MADPQSERERLLAWVERMANHLSEVDGLPPITGRILGWLMVCEPAEQSAGEIAAAIGASRGSMTTNLRQLSALGFVQRVTRPGRRTAHYRLVEDAWDVVVQRQIAALGAFRAIASDGIDLLGAAPGRSQRVRDAHEVFGRLEETLAAGLRGPAAPDGRR
ncbi:MarR family protein [Murinocardiopsis flavida]|uniref:MarR family protein n=1 Tax=Murinocardiopsis flavida TaxID=645275 RepID=A0A2P8DMJ1_9ACTN|nr:MarR family transcriptional regulator [Murinocardiopsis flavida]PSK98424.1 MarR family protein [Murinocardiopsis flavida]